MHKKILNYNKTNKKVITKRTNSLTKTIMISEIRFKRKQKR